MARISLVIPFHRVDNNFVKALTSAVRQTHSDFSIDLLNDGADPEAVERILPRDFRINHFCDGEKKGLSARLNESAHLQDSEFCFRMDSDDVMRSDRIERQAQFLESNPRVSVVGSDAYIIDSRDSVLGIRRSRAGAPRPPSAVGSAAFIHPSVAFRTEWLRENKYNESLKRTEDKEMWVRSLVPGTYAWLPEPLLYYRDHGRQSSYVISQTAREERQLAWRYRRAIGCMSTSQYLMRSYVTQSIKLVVEPTVPSLLRNRRYEKISVEEHRNASEGLELAIGEWRS